MSLTQKKDSQLVTLFKEGDKNAYTVLYQRYYQQIHAFITSKTENYHLAQDLTQQTFQKVYERIDTYSEQGYFKAWLYQIALNNIRDYYKVKKNSQHDDYLLLENEDENGQSFWESISAIHSMEVEQDEQELRDIFMKAIDELPSEQRQVMVMRVLYGLQFSEIAEITNVSINTALGRMRYARNNLIENGKFKEYLP